MSETERGTIFYLSDLPSGAPAACALREHRVALIADLNRLSGPPSAQMAALQQEFIDDRMEPQETLAFAAVAYGLLAEAVAGVTVAGPEGPADSAACTALPGYNAIFFSVAIPADILEARWIDKRRDIVARYNDAVGPAGPQVAALQLAFVSGALDRSVVARYIQQCEEMIEACNSLRQRRYA